MFSFRECAPAEGVERIASLIPRLTILQDARECAPLARLLAAASAIHAGDTLGALSCYHALSASLLSSGARRVSGDLWLDYLLWLVIERPHAFAVMAADGRMEEAERIAMRADLAILGELATLSGAHLYRMAAERHRELQLPDVLCCVVRRQRSPRSGCKCKAAAGARSACALSFLHAAGERMASLAVWRNGTS